MRTGSDLGAALQALTGSDTVDPMILKRLKSVREACPIGDDITMRVIAVVSADVVASSAMSAAYSEAEYASIIGTSVQAMMTAIQQFGGTATPTGDGILGVFGLECASVDDIQHALASTFEIQRLMSEIGAELKRVGYCVPQVRCAVGAGWVGLLDPNRTEDGPIYAFGDVINVVSGLESFAVPGLTRVSAEILPAVRAFAHTNEVEGSPLKGRSQQVLSALAAGFRTDVSPHRLVGRGTELARLNQLNLDLNWGSGAVVLVEGSAGIGKTALIRAALTDSLGKERNLSLDGLESDAPYGLAQRLLRNLLGLSSAAPVGDVMRQIADLCSLGDSEIAKFRELCGLMEGTLEENPSDLRLEGAKDCGEMLSLIAGQVCVLGRVLRITIDGFQWIDACSAAVIHAFVDASKTIPMLLMIGIRDDEPESAGWRARNALLGIGSRVHRLRLGGIETDELAMVGLDVFEVEPSRRQRLAEMSMGNPMIFRELLAGDAIAQCDPSSLRPRSPGLGIWLEARLDRLTVAARNAIDVVCVFGESFPAALLARLNGQDWSRLVGEMLDKELIVGCGDFNGPSFRVASPLVRQHVLYAMAASTRNRIALEIADALEGLIAQGHLAEEGLRRACLLLEGGRKREGWDLLIRLSREARMRSAFESSREVLRSAAVQVFDLFAPAEWLSCTEAVCQAFDEVGSFEMSASCWHALAVWSGSQDVAQVAMLNSCERWIALDAIPQATSVLAVLGDFRDDPGRQKRKFAIERYLSLRSARFGSDAPARVGESDEVAWVESALLASAWLAEKGLFSEARRPLSDPPFPLSEFSSARLGARFSLLDLVTGKVTDAASGFEALLMEIESNGWQSLLGPVLANLIYCYLQLGRYAQAAVASRKIIHVESKMWRSWVRGNTAEALLYRGEVEESAAWRTRAIEEARVSGDVISMIAQQCGLARTLSAQKDHGQAVLVSRKALSGAAAIETRSVTKLDAHLTHAMCKLAAGEARSAVALVDDARGFVSSSDRVSRLHYVATKARVLSSRPDSGWEPWAKLAWEQSMSIGLKRIIDDLSWFRSSK